MVRLGLGMLLESQEDVELVAQAGNVADAQRLLSSYSLDLVFLDLRIPGVHGTSLLRFIRNTYPQIKIIIFSSYATEEDVYQSLHLGAQGYLIKDAEREDILRAVHQVCAGKRWIPAPIAARLAERMHHSELTNREHEVLKLLVRGMSNRKISKALAISESTVKNHMNNLLSKLGATDRLHAVHIALERGLAVIADNE